MLAARWIVVEKAHTRRRTSILPVTRLMQIRPSLGVPPRAGSPRKIYKRRRGLNVISVLSR